MECHGTGDGKDKLIGLRVLSSFNTKLSQCILLNISCSLKGN